MLSPYRDGSRLPDAAFMRMRFLHHRAKAAGRPPGDQAAGTPPDDQADWSRPPALGDRSCCCPARPVVRVLIPPTAARPHSVDFLLCGHHFRTSVGALATAGAIVAANSGLAPVSLLPARVSSPTSRLRRARLDRHAVRGLRRPERTRLQLAR